MRRASVKAHIGYIGDEQQADSNGEKEILICQEFSAVLMLYVKYQYKHIYE